MTVVLSLIGGGPVEGEIGISFGLRSSGIVIIGPVRWRKKSAKNAIKSDNKHMSAKDDNISEIPFELKIISLADC